MDKDYICIYCGNDKAKYVEEGSACFLDCPNCGKKEGTPALKQKLEERLLKGSRP